eukprot:4002061-Alexandrium_andersonii.AAC.1
MRRALASRRAGRAPAVDPRRRATGGGRTSRATRTRTTPRTIRRTATAPSRTLQLHAALSGSRRRGGGHPQDQGAGRRAAGLR